MKRLYICSIVLLLMLGCSKSSSIEKKIGKTVDNCKPDSDCIIRIADITEFEWDKMYVFGYGLSPEAVEEILGIPAPDFDEFKNWWVFVKQGKIVYLEVKPTNIEQRIDGEVDFSDLESNRHYSFTPNTAIFKAKKQTLIENESFYFLTRIN